MSIFNTDPQYKWVALFVLVVAGLALWATPEGWPWILGAVGLIGLVSYLSRNNA